MVKFKDVVKARIMWALRGDIWELLEPIIKSGMEEAREKGYRRGMEDSIKIGLKLGVLKKPVCANCGELANGVHNGRLVCGPCHRDMHRRKEAFEKKKDQVWVCGRVVPGDEWEIQGVFDSEEKARAACRSKDYFIGPLDFNRSYPEETMDWEGSYYPLKEG